MTQARKNVTRSYSEHQKFHANVICDSKIEGEVVLFFEKKNQKTFTNSLQI